MSSSNSIKKIFENIGEGFSSKKKTPDSNEFEISENDPKDVIFAKNLNNSGGKVFYCNNEKKINATLSKLLSHLKISHLYCIDESIQKKYMI